LLFVLLQGSLLDLKPENAAAMIKLLYKVWHRIIIAIRPVLLKYWICFMPAAYSKIFLDNRYFFPYSEYPAASMLAMLLKHIKLKLFFFGILNVKMIHFTILQSP